MAQFTNTDCFAILGRRGSGKSYTARLIQTFYTHVVVVDPMREYTQADGLVTDSLSQLGGWLLALKRSRAPKWKIIFQPPLEGSDSELIFNQLCKIIYHAGNCLFVVEEIQIFAHPHFLPIWLQHLLMLGRHRNIGVMVTTQRCGQLHKSILSQCSHIFAGQMHELNDLNYIRNYLPDSFEQLKNIPQRQFIYWNIHSSKPILISNDLKPIATSP